MGGAIGHEITHGFDDEGRQFDSEGNLSGWWTDTDTKEFNRRAEVVEKQFDGYVAIDSLRVNGKLTLGENIADLGGLIIAHGAYRRALQGKAEPAPIDGQGRRPAILPGVSADLASKGASGVRATTRQHGSARAS